MELLLTIRPPGRKSPVTDVCWTETFAPQRGIPSNMCTCFIILYNILFYVANTQ